MWFNKFQVLSQKQFPKGNNSRMFHFPSGNFPKVRIGLLRRHRSEWRVRFFLEVAAWEITHLEVAMCGGGILGNGLQKKYNIVKSLLREITLLNLAAPGGGLTEYSLFFSVQFLRYIHSSLTTLINKLYLVQVFINLLDLPDFTIRTPRFNHQNYQI